MPAFIISLRTWLLGNSQHVINLSVVVGGHVVGNCVHVCVLTQLVEIACECTDIDKCAFQLFYD